MVICEHGHAPRGGDMLPGICLTFRAVFKGHSPVCPRNSNYVIVRTRSGVSYASVTSITRDETVF